MVKKGNFEAKINFNLLPKLANLGLTKQEAQIYLILLEEGPLSAKDIAKKIDILPHVVYRSAKKLTDNNLIAILKSSPLTFQAMPPQLSLSSFAKEKALKIQKEAEEIARSINYKQTTSTPTKIDLIVGKQNTYINSIKLVDDTKKELLIISIGEPIPEDLLLSLRKAYLRGVAIKMVVHKYDEENKEVLENFKRNGYEIRHYPDWGFHLVVYDGQKALLTINNPQDLRERVSMQIFSQGLAKALRDYFYSVWEKAIKV